MKEKEEPEKLKKREREVIPALGGQNRSYPVSAVVIWVMQNIALKGIVPPG